MEPNNQYEYNREPWEQPTRVVTRTRIWPIVLTAVGTALITLMLCIVFLGGRTNGSKRPSPTKPAEESGSSSGQEEAQKENYADKLEEIKAYIDAYFIGEVDEGQLADKAAAGMIEGLDDEWSYYIPAEEYASYIESVTNSYVGIGVTITSEGVEKGLLVKDVTPESPAYRAGMEIGDLITAVEGVPVLDGSEEAIDLIETKNRVRGPEGTQVTITVVHEGVARDLTITRETIKMVNVTGQSLDNGLYYIRIGNFEQDAAKDTIAKIEEAKAQGAKGIIFDVRYNPGGYKRELVELLDYLLPAGPLFRSLDYAGRESVDNSDEKYLDLPMAVLVTTIPIPPRSSSARPCRNMKPPPLWASRPTARAASRLPSSSPTAPPSTSPSVSTPPPWASAWWARASPRTSWWSSPRRRKRISTTAACPLRRTTSCKRPLRC